MYRNFFQSYTSNFAKNAVCSRTSREILNREDRTTWTPRYRSSSDHCSNVPFNVAILAHLALAPGLYVYRHVQILHSHWQISNAFCNRLTDDIIIIISPAYTTIRTPRSWLNSSAMSSNLKGEEKRYYNRTLPNTKTNVKATRPWAIPLYIREAISEPTFKQIQQFNRNISIHQLEQKSVVVDLVERLRNIESAECSLYCPYWQYHQRHRELCELQNCS